MPINMNKLRPYLYVLLTALLMSLSRLPFKMGFLVFFAWVPMLHFFEHGYHKLKELVIAAAIFAFVFVSIVLSWIATVTPGGLFGIFIIYIFFYTTTFYIIQKIWWSLPRWKYYGFVGALLTIEYLQQFGETRFPWINISYSLADYGILLQALDLIGLSGLTILILVINICFFNVFKKRYRALVTVGLILIVWTAYGLWRSQSIELKQSNEGIYIAQPSIPQDDKWDEAFYRQILDKYNLLAAQAKQDGARLLILPEASFPVYLLRDPGELKPLYQMLETYQMDFFVGFPDFVPAPSDHINPVYYYNAACLFSPDKPFPKPYYKNILVPVGERMLWLDLFPFLWKLQMGQANWEFGKEAAWYQSGDKEFSASICYEIAFPEFYHKTAIPKAEDGLRKTDYLVNITNDAWFGTSYGPWLHGIMTRYRAIENRIQIYRSAQTGISMIVDPLGRTIASTKLFEFTNITAPLYTSDSIPLIRHIYRYPLLICIFTIVLFGLALIRGRGKARNL